jgi:hypothetical protein
MFDFASAAGQININGQPMHVAHKKIDRRAALQGEHFLLCDMRQAKPAAEGQPDHQP